MKKTVVLAAVAMILSTIAFADHQLAVLDGTSWKVEVKPDAMAAEKGEKEFKETLTFAAGTVSLSAPKVTGDPATYSLTKSGEKDVTFTANRVSWGEGSSVWTGTVHGGDVEGKMIWTKNDGAVLTYTFKGSKLD